MSAQSCGVCDASTPPATASEIETWLGQLPRWRVIDGCLVREAKLPDFASALALANRIGAIAEAEGHHPDLEIGWGRLRASVYTHAIGALSRADFVLAARIERLMAPSSDP